MKKASQTYQSSAAIRGTIGGPIIHDHLFFVGNYEGQQRNEPITVNDAPALAGLATQRRSSPRILLLLRR